MTGPVLRRVAAALAVALLLASCGDDAGPRDPERSPDPAFAEFGFPGYPSADHLCDGRVSGGATEIQWNALVSPDDPSTVLAFYEEALGSAGFTADGSGGGTWRVPADTPERTLDVMAAADPRAPLTDCPDIPASARTVIYLTRR
jgi:hypothetical protein